MGDLDYGLRALGSGCRIVVVPGYTGECKANAEEGLWTDNNLPVMSRWRELIGPKGLPVREWAVFCRRHKGVLWPLVWLHPYVRFWVGEVLTSGKAAL
jgi:GT2 family glycosyltransferase